MNTRILFFGALKDVAGVSEKEVNLPSDISNGGALVEWLCGNDEELRMALTQPGIRLCVDHKISPANALFEKPQEIAFLPAYSGG